ncbi:hypothetical protein ILUMI_26144 [Ignelater luminosus]|uniref:HTH psq-type domain-containing protein n=1 Tax=Ignelater luminosus TaxID=2038154 RepID=A0A8K0C8J7_IGNLU|nr:hypothetical protein ILUMI_26144 [Ignelater luminosus]
MEKALDAVRRRVSVASASKAFRIPRITLLYKSKGKYPANVWMGPETILTLQIEELLVKWLLRIAEINAKSNQMQSDLTEGKIRNWFQEINDYLAANHLQDIEKDPRRIYNADETAFFLAPKGTKCLIRKVKNEFLEYLKATLGNEKLSNFKNEEEADEWTGETKDTNLFMLWKNIRNELKILKEQTNLEVSELQAKNGSLPDSSINSNVDIDETRLKIETTSENNSQRKKKEKDELQKENRQRVGEEKKKEAERLKAEKRRDRKMKRKRDSSSDSSNSIILESESGGRGF